MKILLRAILFSLLLAGAAGFMTGCATDDPDDANIDTKPWNTPASWSGPLPSNINQGR